jgi:hypothetical protein
LILSRHSGRHDTGLGIGRTRRCDGHYGDRDCCPWRRATEQTDMEAVVRGSLGGDATPAQIGALLVALG